MEAKDASSLYNFLCLFVNYSDQNSNKSDPPAVLRDADGFCFFWGANSYFLGALLYL